MVQMMIMRCTKWHWNFYRAGGFSGGGNEWITFADAEAKQLGSGEKGDYYNLTGVLTFTFADNAVYKACPQDQCNKKLVDQENGLFRCEKCNREYPNFKYRLLLGVSSADLKGNACTRFPLIFCKLSWIIHIVLTRKLFICIKQNHSKS